MIDNFEYRGVWYLPSINDKKISGRLIYDSSEGCTLELFGSFRNYTFPYLEHEIIILGNLSNGKEVTLYKCYLTQMNGQLSSLSVTYQVSYVLEGVLINSQEELTFQKIECEIHNLDEWIGISGFQPSDLFGDTINVRYECPKPISFPISNNLSGEFKFEANNPGLSVFQKNITINQKAKLIISSGSYSQLKDLLQTVFSFQNFLILSIYDRTYPTSITLYGDKYFDEFGEELRLPKPIKLYYSISDRRNINKTKHPFEMLFTYSDISAQFPSIIKNWYQRYELLEPAFNLLFEQFYNKKRFSENTFLNLAQAAETFHARINNHTKMPKAEYECMKQEILKVIPTSYHKWIKDQFNFGNNLNLQTRLTEIVIKYSNVMLDKIIPDKELFVKQVKWSRNYYTHYSSDGKKNALKGQLLYELSAKLKLLLVCSFLVDVGFTNEQMGEMLKKHDYSITNYYSL